MPALPLDPGDPRELGLYRLTWRLGEGGQGIVYLGEAPSGQRVAVKVLKTADPKARERFAREMAAAQRVAPFCTAQVLDSGVYGAQPYVVSEFVDGPSLQEQVTAYGPLRGGELDRLVVHTATALTAIHSARIVHRDLKPANVLLGTGGPRVVDFGIARAIDTAKDTQLVGTPAYFAPEWLRGEPPTLKSDIFAWAATMVFAATGHPPFGQDDSIPLVMQRIAHGEPTLTGVPAPLAQLLAGCLDKDPAQRPTARQLLVRLVDPEQGFAEDPDQAAQEILVRTSTGRPSVPSRGDTLSPAPEANAPVVPGIPVPMGPSRSEPSGYGGGPVTTGWQPPTPGPIEAVPPRGAGTGQDTGPGGGPRTDAGIGPVLPPPARAVPRRRRGRGALTLLLVAVLVAVGGGAWLLLNRDSRAGNSSVEIPATFVGSWEGTAYQGGDATDVRLEISSDSANGELQNGSCSGPLTVRSTSSAELTLQIARTDQSCPSGTVTLSVQGEALRYDFTGSNGSVSGTLRRTG